MFDTHETMLFYAIFDTHETMLFYAMLDTHETNLSIRLELQPLQILKAIIFIS